MSHQDHGNMTTMQMSPARMNESMKTMKNMGMHTSFFWGKDVVLLFASWPGTGSLVMYVVALAMVFLLAAGAEILSLAPSLKPRGLRSPVAVAFINAVVFGCRMGLAYLVMLSVMSFNLGVFAAAVVGHAVGSFIVNYRVAAVAVAAPPAHVDSSPKF